MEEIPSKAPAMTSDSTAWGVSPVRPHQVPRGGVGAVPLPLLYEELCRLLSHVLHHPQADQNRAPVGDAPDAAAVHAGVEEGHSEAPGVLLQRLNWVKTHGLVVHQGDEELQGVVPFEPRGLVGGDGEGVGVRLREHVLTVDLAEDLQGHVFRHTVAGSPLQEFALVHGDEVVVVGTGEGSAHLVGLGCGHPRHVLYELHHLLLPDDDAAATLQGPLFQGVVVLPLCPVPVPLHELGHGAALDSHPGSDEGHLIG